jgi:hypothetical protein
VSRYGVIASVCAVAGVAGYIAEVLYFGDNETVATVWKILATSGVALLLLVAAASVALARRGGLR